MAEHTYDIVVLGGGIGGYSAAIRASQLGKKVAIVEKDKLGGTCLHRGCIPSKALLRSAEVYASLKNSEAYGICATEVSLQLTQVMERKERIIEQLYQGVQFLMKQNKIDMFYGQGRIIGPSIFSPKCGTISVEYADGEIDLLKNEQVVIATGSRPRTIPGLEIDGAYIYSSEELLNLDQLPKTLLIIGGGVIGVEWASMMSDFGVEVTLVEAEPLLVRLEDQEIAQELERILKKRNVRIITSATVNPTSLQIENQQVVLDVLQNEEILTLRVDKVLVSVGRIANIEGIGIENTDIQIDNGSIRVNEYLQTSESHLYAIGDVIGGVQLAHAAAYEGRLAVEHMCKLDATAYQAHCIPRCMYSRPEVASVGWTEQQAKQNGKEIHISKFPYKAIGKAWVYGDTDGFVKVISDANTKDILGVHMIGPHVTESIAEAALAMQLNATSWEISHTVHPHPTLSEILQEAMLGIDHLANRT